MAEPDRHHAGTAAAGGRVSGAESAGVVKSHRVTESPRVVEPTRVTEPVAPELTRYTRYLMRRAFTHISAKSDRATVARDYAVLAALAAGHGASQLALAERLEINRTIMVKLVGRLQSAGAADPDPQPATAAPTCSASPTPAGRRWSRWSRRCGSATGSSRPG